MIKRSNPITSKTAWALYVGQGALAYLGHETLSTGHLSGWALALVLCVLAFCAAMLATAGVAGFAAVDRAWAGIEKVGAEAAQALSGRASGIEPPKAGP